MASNNENLNYGTEPKSLESQNDIEVKESNKQRILIIGAVISVLLLGGLGIYWLNRRNADATSVSNDFNKSNQYVFMHTLDTEDPDNLFQIFAHNIADNSETQVTKRDLFDNGKEHFYNLVADVSWDGQMVLFNREGASDNNKCYLINRDGTGLKELVVGRAKCISPNGLTFAYSTYENGGEVRILDIEHKNLPKIINVPHDRSLNLVSLKFTSDGKKLFYCLEKYAEPVTRCYLKEIDSLEPATQVAATLNMLDVDMAPDGKKILYTNAANALCIANINGTEAKILDKTSLFKNPIWSRDGKRVLVQAIKSTQIKELNQDQTGFVKSHEIGFQHVPVDIRW